MESIDIKSMLIGSFFLLLNLFLGKFYLNINIERFNYTLIMSIFPLILLSNHQFLKEFFNSDHAPKILGWISIVVLYAHLFILYPMQQSIYH